jgi:hypothetical protein
MTDTRTDWHDTRTDWRTRAVAVVNSLLRIAWGVERCAPPAPQVLEERSGGPAA